MTATSQELILVHTQQQLTADVHTVVVSPMELQPAVHMLQKEEPSNFAFGTELIIDGHTYVVEDRGGAIRGNRIDIFFSSHQAALNYGRRTVDVYVK